MKKKLYLLLALLLVAAAAVVGVLFFVNGGPQGSATAAPEAPVIALADDLSVYWDRVENAESYIVRVNGNDLVSTEQTSFAMISVPGIYTIAVQAVNQAGKSDCSNEVSYCTLGVTLPENALCTVLGAPVVGYGMDYSFTLKIAEGCTQCEPVVKVNGQTVTPDASGKYTVADVKENLTVTVEGVELNSYSVTLPTGTGYTLRGEPVAYYGENYTFTLTLDASYSKSRPVVKANDVELAWSDEGYVIENVTKPQVITVSGVKKNTYTVNLTTGRGYQISPSGMQTVTHGEDITFTVTADSADYGLTVQANGKTLSAHNGVYTVAKVISNVHVTVSVSGLPELAGVETILEPASWNTAVATQDRNSLILASNSSLKAQYLKDLWDAGYTHLVFTVNAQAASDNNTNYTHSDTWSRYWANFAAGVDVDLRIDLNEFHDGNTWYDLNFNAGKMTVSNPRAYKSAETLNWTKSDTNVYFAVEDGYYVLETRGNDFSVTSPTQWLKKYVVKDDVSQRTWLMYTDYITQGNNTRSLVWGWGSPVNTVTEDVNGGWAYNNNVQIDGYTEGEVFSLHLDRAGVARYKVLDWVSGRNGWNEDLALSYVDEQTIRWSAASDYKLRLATTQDLIAAGYTHLNVTLTGNLGDAQIWYGEDDWNDGEICVSANDFADGVCTFQVDLTAFRSDELFTMMANGAKFTDLTVKIEPVMLASCSVTLPTGEGYTVNGSSIAVLGGNYSFSVILDEGYTKSNPVVKVNGTVVEGAGVYTVENVQEDLNITVENVSVNIYTVTKTVGGGYTVTGADSVIHGESYTFRVTADNPHATLVVLVNGAVLRGETGTYTIKDVSEDLNITVQAELPEFDSPVEFFQQENWTGTVLFADENSMKVEQNPSLKADYLKALWEDGYTHLVFKIKATTTGNYVHGDTWDRYWGNVNGTTQDLRIDLNEFHDGNTWYDLTFINMTGPMTVSAPRLYKSPETLSWTKSNTNVYFAIEEGYYVLQTPGNDFGVTSPTSWLEKYVVKDDVGQRTWLVYTDYITQGNNTRSLVWGWGSPVSTITEDVNGGWTYNNNVQLDGYTEGEVFSLHLDRAGVARYKILDWVSGRNGWNEALGLSYVDEQTIRWSAASDYKLRLATTQDLIAQGYNTLKVTLTGDLGSAQIWYGEDDWSDGEVCVSANDFVNGSYTFEVNLTAFKADELFTLMANAASFTDMAVRVEPITDPDVEPGTEPATEPATEPETEPETEPVQPGTQPGTEPGTEPDRTVLENVLNGDSWTGNALSADSKSLTLAANASLKADYLKSLWDEGYTHLVFTVNAQAASDNNTNFTHGGTWNRYWATFAAGTDVDLRIDLNEFHDGDTWYGINFNAGTMTVSNPRGYKSAETLSWTKSSTDMYFAIEDGYYVLWTNGNDYNVVSPAEWLAKYIVKDDADQRTWLMYTDYISKRDNTRSMVWGWGSPVNTITEDVNGGWAWNNNVTADREVFSLQLDRTGTARFKLLDWVSNRNAWSGVGLSYVDAQTICWSAASDYKLRLATTQDLIAQGYNFLKVTLTGDLGSAQIWYGEDDWSDGEICVSTNDFVNGSYTFEVDLTAFKADELFTLMANAASFTDMTVHIEPMMEPETKPETTEPETTEPETTEPETTEPETTEPETTEPETTEPETTEPETTEPETTEPETTEPETTEPETTEPERTAVEKILDSDSWTGNALSANSDSLTLAANASLKADYMKSLWDEGYTHLVFTVNAQAASDNNTNFTHGGTWNRYWQTFTANTNLDLRIDLNEFHDGDTWYSLNFNAGAMTVSNPRAYKSAETLSWVKSDTNVYFAIEDGYYVLETRGNDFSVVSPASWLKKYMVSDDAGQRTWLMYTDYISKRDNTRSMVWGWGSPVNTITEDVNGGWAWNNNVTADREVFSLQLDRTGTARFKLLDWVSNRNAWSGVGLSYVDAQTICWSAASDYKLRLATTQDLIAQGYNFLKVTLTGDLGSAQIWYGEDDWSDGEICVSANDFVDGSYTFAVDLTTFKSDEVFTMMANAASFTDMTVHIEPMMEPETEPETTEPETTEPETTEPETTEPETTEPETTEPETTEPERTAVEKILDSDSWTGNALSADSDSLTLAANASLKADYMKSLWDEGYTHLVFTVNAQAASDNNTNFTHGGTWNRYWQTFTANTNLDLRIDLNEFHDGDTWYGINFNAGTMTVSNPRGYKSAETLSWVKSSTNVYLALEDGYYVMETRGNDFYVTSSAEWLAKYMVKDDAGQRTWQMYTDYITRGNNTRSMLWGWGSPVNTVVGNVNGGWAWNNNVSSSNTAFSLHLDKSGVARFKLLDWVSNRNEWNGALGLNYVDAQTIRWSAASDYKLRLATTHDLIAQGYNFLKVTLTGDLGSAQIWYGEDDWSDGEICISANDFVNGSYTFEVDLSTFNGDENFTLMANTASFTDLQIKIEPIKMQTCNVTLPAGEGYTVTGRAQIPYGSNYSFTMNLAEGYTDSAVVVKVNGEEVTGNNGVYMVENVQKDLIVTVENVQKNVYTVTKPESMDYTVSGEDTVSHGESYSFTVNVNNAGITYTVLVNGAEIAGDNGSYTVENVTSDLVITVQTQTLSAVQMLLTPNSWSSGGTVSGDAFIVLANSSLKADYMKSLWDEGYTHLVFTVNAQAASDNNTNFTHGGTWNRYWQTFTANTNLDLRIDLNEFHDGDTWYSLNFNAGAMTVSNPRAYKSAETLSWVKSDTNVYFAIEDGYYVLETRGNDFSVVSPASWLKKYMVSDDAGQRTWLMYTDYISKRDNTRSMVWGWGSPVNTITEDVNGGWAWNNNVTADREVFSLQLDRGGTARFKLLDWVSNRNEWNGALGLNYVDAQTIKWSAASDYKLRLATTQDLIAAGYNTLRVTLTGDLGSAQIWYGEDDWSDGEICISANDFANGSYTFEVDLTTFKSNEVFTMMANASSFADLQVTVEPVAK